MGGNSLEERVEAMSASLNYIYNENWDERDEGNVTHKLNHEQGTIVLPGDEKNITIDISDSDGLIVVTSPAEVEKFVDSQKAAEYAFQALFTDN